MKKEEGRESGRQEVEEGVEGERRERGEDGERTCGTDGNWEAEEIYRE